MVYGKLFKRLIKSYPEFSNLSANKCSELTYKELRAIAKALYPDNKQVLAKYFFQTREDLAKMVYKALLTL